MSEHATAKIHAQKRTTASTKPEKSNGFQIEGNWQAFERWFHGMLQLSQEVLQFTQARLQEDATAWTQLAGARTFEEALQFQRHFAERMTKEYLEEFNRLSQILAGITNGSAAAPSRADTDSKAAA